MNRSQSIATTACALLLSALVVLPGVADTILYWYTPSGFVLADGTTPCAMASTWIELVYSADAVSEPPGGSDVVLEGWTVTPERGLYGENFFAMYQTNYTPGYVYIRAREESSQHYFNGPVLAIQDMADPAFQELTEGALFGGDSLDGEGHYVIVGSYGGGVASVVITSRFVESLSYETTHCTIGGHPPTWWAK